MGNYISKINKDPFLVYEEVIKNDFLLAKGVLRRALDMGTKGTCTGAHSLMRFSEIMTLALLQTGVWWRDL